MHCKACNAPIEDRKDPSTGSYTELCVVCNRVSRDEALAAARAAEDRREDVPLRSAAETFGWSKALYAHDFGEGLGLMDETQRVTHLRKRASERFREARDQGMTFLAAVEFALGHQRFRGNQRETT